MDSKYKINEVAKLLNISVPTLHYWESEGLFQASRDNANDYRYFTTSDILNIWEIILLRELEIPVKEVKKIQNETIDELRETYQSRQSHIENEIERLLEISNRLNLQQLMIEQCHLLAGKEPFLSPPDISSCYVDVLGAESLKMALDNPNICGLFFPDGKDGVRCLSVCIDSSSPIWVINNAHKYYEFLLMLNPDNINDNNLDSIREKIKVSGHTPGEVISKYLLLSYDSTQNRRFEYHRAWIQVID